MSITICSECHQGVAINTTGLCEFCELSLYRKFDPILKINNNVVEIKPDKVNRSFLFYLTEIGIIGSPFWVFILCLIFK